ncbi:hypothetical protein ACFOD4_04725 [Pseudoroseomonas globiformis]|uniref:Uncharacterized protein n=1 Tax=Teichococcus globiformis TaxID=2307229 RepID=A0ABV7G027_9PROT
MSQPVSLSPKDLSPAGIAEWLSQAEQIMAQFSDPKNAPASDKSNQQG